MNDYVERVKDDPVSGIGKADPQVREALRSPSGSPLMVSSIASEVRHISPLLSLVDGLPPGVKVTITIETPAKEPRE